MKQRTPESRAEARARLERALTEIQHAQNRLGEACGHLSSLMGALQVWGAVGREADRVKALWYRVERLRRSRRLDLDSLAGDP